MRLAVHILGLITAVAFIIASLVFAHQPQPPLH